MFIETDRTRIIAPLGAKCISQRPGSCAPTERSAYERHGQAINISPLRGEVTVATLFQLAHAELTTDR